MPNHLVNETSPYLLQHADNPVDWHPWNAATLQLARELDKPILLSIGYSACHWCHVMAHESFEDAAVAAVMNEHFVNIKVDREERPDLDQIYQNAHQLLARRGGGWPLTMFLAPDGTPFYSGTYFPKQARYGLPGFPELLQHVARVFRENRKELAAQNEQLLAALADWQPERSAEHIELDAAPVGMAAQQLVGRFDPVHGGFGGAPKFLHPAELDLLLRRREQQSTHAAVFTLQQMALGGLYDQLGGGFCRYSVDASWDIPHFEKMLYDNGLLLGLYSDAWLASGDPLFARVVEQTAGWVLREVQAPDGGYYSSLDADSEHEEGKFYVWQRDEIRKLLSAEEYALIKPYFGLDSTPNFEDHAWHLRVAQPLSTVAQNLHLNEEQASSLLASARAKLFAAREKRIRPGRDEKILGSWNGLMIAGMAKAARIFHRKDWLHSAQQAMDFAHGTLWQNGKLLATHKDGKTHLNAYLD
ncbi:MAG: thioredoxin domain-containing protein, partial [Gammaproteobacteria bacterium]|nr:thioredoxin domain-containing protein [Gammaproteobacteria bacterium]